MKKIYIILTHTGTILSKIIQNYTKDEFSHVSVALDEDLNNMYSFGRLNPYNPFIGGFIHEYIDKGTFKRFKKTKTKILELDIEEDKYLKLKEVIEKIQNEKEKYKFNVLGLFAIGFNKKIQAENSFYCAEFVKYVMEKSDIINELPELIRPESFKNIHGGKEIYKGLLKEYKKVLVLNKANIVQREVI